mmetsp:Transcript_41846/g.106478  ORF Transcript_41846/g.106478 Transcript_41846/m.106478 type:complete len:454 (-) Transcript_41846:241-1602(-)
MAPSQARRSSPLLPALAVGAGLCLLRSSSWSFLAAKPASQVRAEHGRTAMRGFKEDFESWRSSLTPEERKMVQNQATGEYNKKFRKSPEFSKNLPDEKLKSFANILGKFFDTEAADYKKELERKVPNYNQLLEKAGDKVMDLSLKPRIVEMDRDADRRYHWTTVKEKVAAAKGERFANPSPYKEYFNVEMKTKDDQEFLGQLFEKMKAEAAEMKDPQAKKALEDFIAKQSVPAIGGKHVFAVEKALSDQIFATANAIFAAVKNSKEQGMTDEQVKTWLEKEGKDIYLNVSKKWLTEYIKANAEVEKDVQFMKDFFRSEKNVPGRTKADVLKEMWALLPEVMGKPVPPIDEGLLESMSKLPATDPEHFQHPWGTAEKLYKSEAVDPFGTKYLLGIYATKEEAQKAFKEWSGEYDKAREDMKVEMAQWSKQENARLDKDTSARDRVKKILEEARR